MRAGQVRRSGGAKWEILNPPKGEFTGGRDDAPNASIAYLLMVNGVRLLFTGDTEKKVLDSIGTRLDERIDGTVDVFLATTMAPSTAPRGICWTSRGPGGRCFRWARTRTAIPLPRPSRG